MPLSRNPTGPLEGLSGFDSSGKVRLSPNDPDAPRLLALYPDRYVMTSAAQAAPYLATSSGSPLVGDLASLGYSASDIAALTAAQQQRGSAAPVTPAISTVSPGGGVTIGEYEDYRAVAEQALRSIGIVNADRFGFLSDADIDRFALAKMDVEAIAADYARRPEVQAINPGAELGLSREGYFTGREGHEEAYSQRFGKTSTLDETRRRARAPQETGAAQAEPDWLKEVFQERFSPEQSAEMFGDYFRRTGRAPTSDEIGTYRTRSQQRFAGRVVEPSYTPPWTREEKGERPQARELGPRGGGSAGPFGRTR